MCYGLFALFIHDYYTNQCIHSTWLCLVNYVKRNRTTKHILCTPYMFAFSWLDFPSGPGLLCEGPCSPLGTRRSVGILWTSDLPIAETSFYTTTHNTHKKQTSVPPVGFESADPRFRSRDHCVCIYQIKHNSVLRSSEVVICRRTILSVRALSSWNSLQQNANK